MELKIRFKFFSVLLIVVFFISTLRAQSSDFVASFSNRNQFDTFQNNPLVLKYGSVKGVKVVYDLLERKLYFVNGERFLYHGDFCRKVLKYKGSTNDFNKYNYSTNPNQRFLLANINYYNYLDKYVLEFGVSNETTPAQMKFFYEVVRGNVFFSDKFFLLINNKRTKEVDVEHTIDIQQLYLNQTYQPLYRAKGYGRLVFCDKDSVMNSNVLPNDILVTNGSPNELPVVSGVITSDLQGPLSHITLLGINRGIPIMSLKDCWTNIKLRSFQEKLVELDVKKDLFDVRKISEFEFEFEKSNRFDAIKIRKDVNYMLLPDGRELSPKMIDKVGGKAAYFGLLTNIDFEKIATVPEGAFAIPFYYYEEHLRLSGADQILDSIFKGEYSTTINIHAALKRARKTIKAHEVNSKLLEELNNKIIERVGVTKVRFRSSTNAEDVEGFNGAGLYASKSAIPNSAIKPVDKALKKVWASLWSIRAYEERSLFNIDQKEISMAVLVHKAFPNEVANGVALTKNMYRENYPGVTISVQKGEESVVAPNEGVLNDHFIAFLSSDLGYTKSKVSLDWVSRSSINNGKPVLTMKEIESLLRAVAKVKRAYFEQQKLFNALEFHDLHLDIEFKIAEKSRRLYIKQVRSLNIK